MYELFHGRVGRWRMAGFYMILAGMSSVTRGLITTIIWMGLALGITSTLSKVLQGRHAVDRPSDVHSVVR